MTNSERQLQTLGVFVHGVLFGLHVLGAVYNWRRRNWLDVGAHACALSYDGYAVRKHLRTLSESHDDQLSPVQ